MALNSYLIVTGEKQGLIKGGVVQKGREGWIEVNSFEHQVTSPRDPATGQATGKRAHKPICVRFYIDQSTINIYQAFVSNENLKTVELRCFAPNKVGSAGGSGQEVLHFVITLTNAAISSIKTEMLNNKNPELTRYEKSLEVEFVYQKIEWKWMVPSESAQDDFYN